METVGITYKTRKGVIQHRNKPHAFASRALSNDIQSIRIPVSYKGQFHLPGYFWMSRMSSMVAYESRLEMTVLLHLDFNRTVTRVISQPFLLHYLDRSHPYRHTPDFLVVYDNGAVEVVNVKPRQFINTVKNARAFRACEQVAIEMGWAYSTRCEMDLVYLANLKWLAAYRRLPVGLHQYGDRLVEISKNPISIARAIREIDGLPALIRPVLFHLLWTGVLNIDLHKRMTNSTLIHAVAGTKRIQQ